MRIPACLLLATLLAAGPADAARVLFFTRTDGFRHDSIQAGVRSLTEIARRSGGRLEVEHTEDIGRITAAGLAPFDAVFFFTSGELPFSDAQKRDLLAYVRDGKGFLGAHSATDTLYTWPEYGEMIGGYFDGHPWAQEAVVNVEDPGHPAVRHLAPRFRMVEEFYQFRAFSRDRVRVLLTLDVRSVNLRAEGVNRSDKDFALAWVRQYGRGRVFYTAFGHFDDSWLEPRWQTMLLEAMLWAAGQAEGDAAPRSGPGSPAPQPAAIEEEAAPGAILTLYGAALTGGSTLPADAAPLPHVLAGTRIEINGETIPLYYASPGQVNALLPSTLPGTGEAALTLWSGVRASAPVRLRLAPAAPRILAAARVGDVLVLYASGLGAASPAVPDGDAAPLSPLSPVVEMPTARVNGEVREVAFAGLAPGLVGVYQVNVVSGGATGEIEVALEAAGRRSPTFRYRFDP